MAPNEFRVTTTNHKDIAEVIRQNRLAKNRKNLKDNKKSAASTPPSACAALPHSQPWMEYQRRKMRERHEDLLDARLDRANADIDALFFEDPARVLLMLISECCREDLKCFAQLIEEQRQRFPEHVTPTNVATMRQLGMLAIKGFWYRYHDLIRCNITLCDSVEESRSRVSVEVSVVE